MILAHMQSYVLESEEERKALATIKALNDQDELSLQIYSNQVPAIVCKSRVLLDGGASHNVYYSSEIPEGSIKKQVELAHGSKVGYVKGEDIIFLDKAKNVEESNKPTIISLGRLIRHGMKLIWSKDKAYLLLPSKKTISLPIYNNCPYANDKVLDIVKQLRLKETRRLQVRDYYARFLMLSKLEFGLRKNWMNTGDKDTHDIHQIVQSVNEEQRNRDLIKDCLHERVEN